MKGLTMKTHTEPTDYVMVTDWEEVEADDFYLTNENKDIKPETLKQAKEIQANDNLYIGYIVAAVNYVVYRQMDARQIFIDEDSDEIMSCEYAIINNNHTDRFQYSY